MSRHTAGPWALGKPHGHTRVEIVGDSGNRMVASVVDVKAQFNPETNKNDQVQCPEGEANARLIAAAPDLLEVAEDCRRILTWLEGQRDLNKVEVAMLARANAAIARATQPIPPQSEDSP